MGIEIIRKKKEGQELTQEEIRLIINEYHSGVLGDDLMKDFLKAVKENGLSIDETVHLTQAMADTGERIDWKGTKVENKKKIFASFPQILFCFLSVILKTLEIIFFLFFKLVTSVPRRKNVINSLTGSS